MSLATSDLHNGIISHYRTPWQSRNQTWNLLWNDITSGPTDRKGSRTIANSSLITTISFNVIFTTSVSTACCLFTRVLWTNECRCCENADFAVCSCMYYNNLVDITDYKAKWNDYVRSKRTYEASPHLCLHPLQENSSLLGRNEN